MYTNVYVDVVYKDETFWMTQKAIAELFDVNVPAISRHIKNVLEDGELVSVYKVTKHASERDGQILRESN
jgi:hypothetical protein